MQDKKQQAPMWVCTYQGRKAPHVIPLRLHNLEYCEKTYHQFYLY